MTKLTNKKTADNQRVSAANAKAHFSDLMARVAYGGEHFIIERRGRPVAALVNVTVLQQLQDRLAMGSRPKGALALVGAWSEVGDEELDAAVAQIYRKRSREKGRRVSLES